MWIFYGLYSILLVILWQGDKIISNTDIGNFIQKQSNKTHFRFLLKKVLYCNSFQWEKKKWCGSKFHSAKKHHCPNSIRKWPVKKTVDKLLPKNFKRDRRLCLPTKGICIKWRDSQVLTHRNAYTILHSQAASACSCKGTETEYCAYTIISFPEHQLNYNCSLMVYKKKKKKIKCTSKTHLKTFNLWTSTDINHRHLTVKTSETAFNIISEYSNCCLQIRHHVSLPNICTFFFLTRHKLEEKWKALWMATHILGENDRSSTENILEVKTITR